MNLAVHPSIQTASTLAPESPRTLLENALKYLRDCADRSGSLIASSHTVNARGNSYEIPKFLLLGQRGGGEPIRLGLFSGFESGHVETVRVLQRVLLALETKPALARDYALVGYPIVNVHGFEDAPAPLSDFERRFAHDIKDEDVQYFKAELRKWAFSGLISFRAATGESALHAAVRSEVIARQVVLPALHEVASLVPLATRPVRVRPEDRYARLADYSQGRLAPPADVRPYPFEVELFIPAESDFIEGVTAAVIAILRNYRAFIAHGAEL